jgi:hypothetical protein
MEQKIEWAITDPDGNVVAFPCAPLGAFSTREEAEAALRLELKVEPVIRVTTLTDPCRRWSRSARRRRT